MTRKPPANPVLGEALFHAAEVMSIAGRAPSRRVILQQALQRSTDSRAARPWSDRAVARGDRDYIRDLSLLLTDSSPDITLPEWLVAARNQMDEQAPYCAEELQAQLANIQITLPSDRSGPLCYVLHMSLPENGSGYSVRSQHLIRAMQKSGLDPYCITRLGFPADLGLPLNTATQIVDGIRYHRIPHPGKRNFRDMRYVGAATRTLVAQLAPLQPSAIMAASNHESAVPALLTARRLGVPFIYEMRGFWELSQQAIKPEFGKSRHFHIASTVEAELASRADLVFTLSEAMRDELRRRGVKNRNIHILPNAADPAILCPAPRDADLSRKLGIAPEIPVIGYIGSFNVYEGLDDLIRACVTLHHRGTDFRLLMIGSEPAHLQDTVCPEIRRIAAEGGIGNKLIMPGRVPVQEVDRWYSLVDIVPIPRKDLPVTRIVPPLKPLEAMSMGKAVVITDLPALREIVTHQETGLVVPGNDANALADALGKLIADPELRRILGQQARAAVEQDKNWDRVAEKLSSTIRAGCSQMVDSTV